eukprot:7605914-Karenia_brevis.AAC.1
MRIDESAFRVVEMVIVNDLVDREASSRLMKKHTMYLSDWLRFQTFWSRKRVFGWSWTSQPPADDAIRDAQDILPGDRGDAEQSLATCLDSHR